MDGPGTLLTSFPSFRPESLPLLRPASGEINPGHHGARAKLRRLLAAASARPTQTETHFDADSSGGFPFCSSEATPNRGMKSPLLDKLVRKARRQWGGGA
jgi:hypothetical protein